jgi:hypothetical protein
MIVPPDSGTIVGLLPEFPVLGHHFGPNCASVLSLPPQPCRLMVHKDGEKVRAFFRNAWLAGASLGRSRTLNQRIILRKPVSAFTQDARANSDLWCASHDAIELIQSARGFNFLRCYCELCPSALFSKVSIWGREVVLWIKQRL